MELSLLSWYHVLLTAGSLLLFFFLCRRESKSKLSLPLPPPPGPPAWLILRNLFQLLKRPHESLHGLSLQYGPIMTFRLGVRTTVVISSPAMAKEVLKIHDHNFAVRPLMEAFKSFSHHKFSLLWGEYGPNWRHFRRVSIIELFSTKSVYALQRLRRDHVFHMIRLIFEDGGKAVDIGRMAFCTSMNVLGNMIFSTNVCDPGSPDSVKLKNTIWRIVKLVAMPNMADYFPFLRFLDPQGVSQEATGLLRSLYEFSDSFIQKRLAATSHSDSEKDFLDALLDFRSEDFTMNGIRALISELFAAGTETSITTVEWGMAEFIRNPQKLKRLRQEMDEVVGCKRRVEESDLDRLPYLHAAVKETFRLHPAVPVILPHEAVSSCEIGGFVIPKHSQVIVNIWAIGRDPSIWNNPLEFVPERFLEKENSKIEFGGQNFELIPFGSGRKMCPAIPLASRMIHFVLASLLHSFEWGLPNGMKCEQMDVTKITDELGVTFKEMKAIPVPRLPHHIY